MPPFNPNSSSTTIQRIVNYARAYPELAPIFPTSGWSQEPAVSIANDTMQKLLSEPLNWRWNKNIVPPFLTSSLQQDYITNITDIAWLENATIYDINNNVNNVVSGGPRAAKPSFTIEAVREILPNSMQGRTSQISFLPNSLAITGSWHASTSYPCSYGASMTPTSPIQQFWDDNGNLLHIDSSVLGLSLDSPGYAGTTITLPDNSPYGVSGSVKPCAEVNAAPGTKVQDGTVIWTVADLNAFCLRVNPLPPVNGLAWLVAAQYQQKAPQIASLQQTIAPIPDSCAWMFRDLFIALLHVHVGSKMAPMRMQMAEEAIMKSRIAADREAESHCIVPSMGLTGGSMGPGNLPLVGPGWPFGPTY
jgi:hypothetical protein